MTTPTYRNSPGETAMPLPARSTAVDKSITSIPQAQWTTRQQAYAAQYGLRSAVSAPGQLPATDPNSVQNLSGTQRDAYAYLDDLLGQYGLSSLTQFVKTELTAGKTQSEIALDLQQTPEYKKQFPEIQLRKDAGLPAIGPGEIMSYRKAAGQLMQEAGLPAGFYDDPSDFTNLMVGNVSLNELNGRIQGAKEATYNMDPNTAARLAQDFGLTPGSGALASFFLDPTKALPLLQNQANAAKIGGQADNAGYAGLGNDTTLALAQQGVTQAQAGQGFNALAHEQQLFQGLPGEQAPTITQKTQLDATFSGNADAQSQIEQRRQARQAQFADGGAFASTQQGMTGLGSAQT